MAEDERQRDASAAGEPRQQWGAGQPAASPNDATTPPNTVPGCPYPTQPAGGYPLAQPPQYPPPGYGTPQYPGAPPTPYPYGPPTGPYGYPTTPQPPVTVATMPPWLPPAPEP